MKGIKDQVTFLYEQELGVMPKEGDYLFERSLQVFSDIHKLLREDRPDPILLAIDGPCTSGKTTMASIIAGAFDCNVFHMDDFFLKPHQRTKERLDEIGGNVDYERFLKEVIIPLKEKCAFSYGVYDCRQQKVTHVVKTVPKRLNLIEGSYSRHPYFGNCYDLTCCLTIDPKEQRERILKRNGPEMLQRFEMEWIPMENAYFKLVDG